MRDQEENKKTKEIGKNGNMVAWANNTSCTPPPNCKINVVHVIENKWLHPFFEGRRAFNSPPRIETHWGKQRIGRHGREEKPKRYVGMWF